MTVAAGSDRSADFRILARWFAETASEEDAHRLWRVAFALSPARHLTRLAAEAADESIAAGTPWAEGPVVMVPPRWRATGHLTQRGPMPAMRSRNAERALLSSHAATERQQLDQAVAMLATGSPIRLSEMDTLDPDTFGLFLALLGAALFQQGAPDEAVRCQSTDGLIEICLKPLDQNTHAAIRTSHGVFSGRDHLLTITSLARVA